MFVNRCLCFYLADGRTVCSTSQRLAFNKAVDDLAADSGFFLCGASLCMNLYCIKYIEKDAAVLKSGRRVPLPKRTRLPLRAAWLEYWFH